MCRPSFALAWKHGPSKVQAAIYMHGAPPVLCALGGYLDAQKERDAEQTMWRSYMADATCGLLRAIKPKLKLPFYSAVIGKTDLQKTDSRSGRDIMHDLIKRRRQKSGRKALHGGDKP